MEWIAPNPILTNTFFNISPSCKIFPKGKVFGDNIKIPENGKFIYKGVNANYKLKFFNSVSLVVWLFIKFSNENKPKKKKDKLIITKVWTKRRTQWVITYEWVLFHLPYPMLQSCVNSLSFQIWYSSRNFPQCRNETLIINYKNINLNWESPLSLHVGYGPRFVADCYYN